MNWYKTAQDKVVEIQSDLFQESGANASTDEDKIQEYINVMERYGGWGNFPPVTGTLSAISQTEFEIYQESEEGGYAYELGYSRPLTENDVGTVILHVEDGHNRAYAARRLGIPIKAKVY